MIQNPFDCKISVLEEKQIQMMIELLLQESGRKSTQIQSYKDRGVEDMFWIEIQKLRNDIADLSELHVQFLGALRVKQKARIINSN